MKILSMEPNPDYANAIWEERFVRMIDGYSQPLPVRRYRTYSDALSNRNPVYPHRPVLVQKSGK